MFCCKSSCPFISTHVQLKCTAVGTFSTEYVLLVLCSYGCHQTSTHKEDIFHTRRSFKLHKNGNKLNCLIDSMVHNLWNFQYFTFDGYRL